MSADSAALDREPLACRSCGNSNPAGARFCNQCGRRLDDEPSAGPAVYTPPHLLRRGLADRASMIGARKRVTVLFADLCGSTRLAERLGAEPWHELLDRFLGLLSAEVHRFEGTVNQYTGDGVMALFGAPIAHEDHAQRACLAALAMQEAVHRFAQDIRLRQGVHLLMRVGLHSGEVVVGSIGDDLRMDYTAQGLTVHLAARMESVCEPGRVYLTQDTASLAQGYVTLKDLGETEVAGVSQAVRVFELLGAERDHTRLDRALARGAAHFIGRGAELEALQLHLAQIEGQGGAVIAVSGDAGIGKSRLCHEFATACEQRSLRVLRAHGVPYGRAFPLLPMQTLLRQRLGVKDGESGDALRQRVAGAIALYDPQCLRWTDAAIEFIGGDLTDNHGEADLQAAEAFLCDFLLTSSVPQLLLIEDLHFVDAASRAVIEHLCSRVATTRSLLLLNYRADYQQGWLQPYLRAALPLQPLGARDVTELAQALVGGANETALLRGHLVERTQGNPFFLEEAVQALVESGHLAGHRGAYELRQPIIEWPIPDTVHALIASRIDRLSRQPKRMLQIAAVIGQEFDADWLERLGEPAAVSSQWQELERAGFVLRQNDAASERYGFANSLTREVAYREQLEAHRRTTHAQIAGLLEAEMATSANADLAGQIAVHWLRGGQPRAAGLWSLRAGHGIALRKPAEAVFWYRQTLEHLQDQPADVEVLRARIGAHAGLVRMPQLSEQVTSDEADQHFAQARELCLALREERLEIELLISYAAEQLHRGDARRSVVLAQEALERAERAGTRDVVDRFRLTALLSFNAVGRLDDGLRRVNAAGGDAWLRCPINASNYRSRGFRGVMLIMRGELGAAEEQLGEALRVADQIGRPEGWLHAMMVDLAWFRGEGSKVMYHAQCAMEQAEASDSAYFRALATRSLGVAHGLCGSPEQALPLLEAARADVCPGGQAHHLEGSFLAVLAETYHAAGDLRRATRVAARAVASARRSGSCLWELRAWVPLLALPVDAARRPRVERSLQRAFELCDSIQADGIRPHLHLARARWTADASVRSAELERARAIFERIGANGHLRRLASA